MRLGTRLCVLGLLCMQGWALGRGLPLDPTSGQVDILAFCDDPQVNEAVDEALQTFNSKMSSGYKMALYQITQATKAVNDSGAVVSALFTSKRSNCPAEGDKPWRECDYLSDRSQAPSTCNTTVYVTETKAAVQSVFCELDPPVVSEKFQCMGCPMEIDQDHEDLRAPLAFSLNKFNAMSNSTHFFVINSVGYATRQVVAGLRFSFTFDMRKSNCSKEDNAELHAACYPDPDDEELANCRSTVDVAPWRHELPEGNVDCEPGPMAPSVFTRRRPPGWSPLRNVVNFESKVPDATTPAPTTPASTSPSPSAKEESSEESQEKTGTTLPPPSPSAPADSPYRCPSKPWKEFVPPTASAPHETAAVSGPPEQDGAFSDADLQP